MAKLREAERLQGQGMTVAQVCRRIGVSDQTFFPWSWWLRLDGLSEKCPRAGLTRDCDRALGHAEYACSISV